MKRRPLLLLSSVFLAVASTCAAASSALYRNVEYGFAVRLPPQASVEQATPPAPAHGAVVHLASGARIRIDGQYDAAFLGSASAAARRVMEDESFDPAVPTRTVRTAGPSARCFGRMSDGLLQRRCVVYRRRVEASAIIYTLALDGSAGSPGSDEAAFDRIVRSFRLEPLPR